ncbi:MAG: putative quinol monooxygenase [Solirubrobacteraceae bacterium]
MILTVGDIYSQVPQRTAAEEAMLNAQRGAREQDGCLSYQFTQALEEPGHFVVVQRWRDRGALDAHFHSPSFTAYQRAIKPLLIRDSELLVYDVQETFRPLDSTDLDLDQDD